MLKSVLYYLLLLTTSVRLVDIIFLLTKNSTNLPVPVIAVTSAMILYGIVLGAKKFVTALRLKELMTFYLIQTGMIVFNLIFVAVGTPLSMSAAETFVVGTFLDLIVNVVLIYTCIRQIRTFTFAAPVTEVREPERRVNV